jgi:two-component sensor histidine kinase
LRNARAYAILFINHAHSLPRSRMTSTPVILLIDSHASDRTLSRVLLQDRLPQARITEVHNRLALIDELTANSPDVVLVAADFQGTEITSLVATLRKQSPGAAVILFGHESDLRATVLQPGLACEGIVSKSSAGFLALGEIVTGVLERATTGTPTYVAPGTPESEERDSLDLDGIPQYLDVIGRESKPTFIDLRACLEKAVENLSPIISETQAEIRLVDTPLRSIGDEQQIIHLFENLVSNAIKFRNADRPVITISADRCGDRWLMRFRDNGIGIPESSTERIFQVGTRLHTAEEYPGEGIGLAMCSRIVEQHGGRIWVESRPGEGSTFLMLLPNVEQAVANPAKTPVGLQPDRERRRSSSSSVRGQSSRSRRDNERSASSRPPV